MSLVLMATTAILLAAIVLIEFRAVREGDERRHHAPGYAAALGGLVLIGVGIALAIVEAAVLALVVSLAGLGAVAFGASRHHPSPVH